MVGRNSERGEGKVGLVITLVLAIVVGMFMFQYIPERIKRAELKDFMVEQSRYAAKVKDPELIRRIYGEAANLGIDLPKKAVTINRSGGRIKIRVQYTKTLEFPGYSWDYVVDDMINQPFYNF
jgi:hypothetical protein